VLALLSRQRKRLSLNKNFLSRALSDSERKKGTGHENG
jgi:hypothetical protein